MMEVSCRAKKEMPSTAYLRKGLKITIFSNSLTPLPSR